MRCLGATATVLMTLALSAPAWGQMLSGPPYYGPSFGTIGMPDGLYQSITIPGMGRGMPSLWLYFPSTGQGGFTPTPMAGQVAGLQLPVTGTGGSVYLPSPGSGVPMLNRNVGGGLNLPTPPPPTRPAAPAPANPRRAATKKAAEAPVAQAPAPDEGKKAAEHRSTLKERRGVR